MIAPIIRATFTWRGTPEIVPVVAALTAKAATDLVAQTKANIASDGWVDTGAMMNNVHAEKVHDTEWNVISPQGYSIYTHEGTVRMAGTRWMSRAVTEVSNGYFGALQAVMT